MSSSSNSDSGGQHALKYEDEDFASSPLLEEADEDDDLVIPLITSPKPHKKSSKKSKKKEKRRRNPSPSLSPSDSDVETRAPPTKKNNRAPVEEDPIFSDQEVPNTNRALTKRQKAKYLDEYEEELLELKEESRKKHFTEEELALRRSETARRRKHQSQQKAEKDKLETINRLLKKQANKKSRADQLKENSEETADSGLAPEDIRYVMSSTGEATLSFPEEYVHLIDNLNQVISYPSEKPSCMVDGCTLSKKYCHPTTGKISCSLDHYKQLL